MFTLPLSIGQRWADQGCLCCVCIACTLGYTSCFPLGMSPPSFETIGSQVEEFVSDDLYWNSPNMKFNFASQGNTGLLVSLLARPPNYAYGPFYAYNNCCRSLINAEFFVSPFKDAQLTFTFFQPASFGTKFTLPLLMNAVQQEFSAALSSISARKHTNTPFKDPALRSRSSFSSDNMVVDLVTESHGKKVKSYLALVLSKGNFLVGPRVGASLRKPSHWYFDLKLGYTSRNIEAFGFFSLKRFQSLQRFSYGVLRRHPRFDLGLISFSDRASQQKQQLTVAVCYKPNSWSFIKFCLTQDGFFAWNYGFSLTNGVVTTVGFSSNLGPDAACAKFNASVSIAS
ncbi:expressed conserved protein [Echinococcus multilocularis]|uniref:Expressed conserved protein n=1 Tax=Echinococcus multilocularis TaxID=6211 RepID=A0A068YCN6_ECHMU|nr:expressed conserved protein [Echinococcus multilocularis]